MTSDIKIRTLIGPAIKTYIPSIVKIWQQLFSETPYLQLIDPQQILHYARNVSLSKDSIAVLIFDGPHIIGAATGIPLSDELPIFQEAFIKQGLPIEDYYFFSLCALSKPYLSRGLIHHFFDIREAHVRRLKRFSKLCFINVPAINDIVKKPHPLLMDTFWKKQGYMEHAEIKTLYPLIDSRFSIYIRFWTKQLKQTPLILPKELNELRESFEESFK